ncbi:transglycosylase SLT domain-containing protein [Nocardia flavorosea]|uniref:transglycosylase SLT domain-containing protein n=1 Tax=Nocardia flavorosea TaxID=53429 RepID=UPI001E367124|nr:transglycosylase SLT domain-containing protein [Nocardia flavorosea]
MRPAGYWQVELASPPGASSGFAAVLDAAEQAIQNCADLMATGAPTGAVNMLDMLDTQRLVQPGDNSIMIENYNTKIAQVDTIRHALQRQHEQVLLSADSTYDASSTKLTAIKFHVQALQIRLGGSYPLDRNGRLPAHTETKLLELVLDTVDDVFGETESAASWIGEQSYHIDGGTSDLGRAATPDLGNTGTTAAGNSGSFPPIFPMMPLGDMVAGDDERDRDDEREDDRPTYLSSAESDYSRYTGNTSTAAAISGALDALGIQDPEARENWTRGYLVLIARESGGNPNAVNNWDSNAAAGQNSRGLTQTIPSTFRAYHVRGTSTDIHDPVANVAASMNYVMDRYDVDPDGSNLQSAVQQADPNRPAKGY